MAREKTPHGSELPLAGFELWNRETANLIADYDTEEAALAAIAEAVNRHGPAYVEPIVLLRIGPRGGQKRLAAGASLVARARRCSPTGAAQVG